ncbi:angiotensin-converting enzyme [Scaptodrosophila lebanonensis]|uniref:Angiotensin-converting enzyme n=1 Tax=Drosophila lebanonensis TaxID=7225 RepID=A0A6J2TPW1_DROLE|nr:angiotensin-converting enzyme [Scaptodrosophila lebanonensis]
MLKKLLLLASLGLARAATEPDATLAAFLNETNDKLAAAYDQEVLGELRNELQGPNDLIALLQVEIANEKLINYVKSITPRAKKYVRLKLGDAVQRRQLEKIPQLGYEMLPEKELRNIYALTSNMSENYHNVHLCAFGQPQNCTLKLIPDVQQILHESQNLKEIEYYWFEWRRCTGLATRSQFVAFMELYKKTAQLNGYAHAEDYWFRSLELSGRETMALLDGFMDALRPLFLQFHAHVRGSLRKMYGEQLVPKGKPYPQHLAEIFLGNAFRRVKAEWFVDLPYPDVGLPNITEALQQRNLNTTMRVFWHVAEYYRELGMPQLEDDLYRNAKPVANLDGDRCWHKAWRFYDLPYTNFSYCALNDEERFFNMFEAQSDLHYYRSTSEQPTLLREEPFPSFSDAIGKSISLAASSPRYLHKFGLTRGAEWRDLPARLNRLYLQGMRVVFLLPVFYVLDRYRVEVLSGRIRADDNEAYWRLTEEFTGAAAPRRRSNEQFDVPAKLLLEVDDQYASHIMSIVLQFQLYTHFCNLTNQYVDGVDDKPLDLCDLSGQRQVGPRLRRAMALGSSLHYREVLQEMLGERELSLNGLLSYFQPLYEWLVMQNRLNGLEVGWT